MDQLRKQRTVAKSLFTRASKSLQNSIKLNDTWELVEKKLSDLESRYIDVQEKHELYLIEMEEKSELDGSAEDSWIDDIQTSFEEVERLTHHYIKHCKQVTDSQIDHEETESMSLKSKIFTENERFDNLRQFEKSELQNEVKKIENLLANTDIDQSTKNKLLKEYQSELKNQLERCKNAQAQYLSTISRDQVSNEIPWTDDVHSIYSNATTKLLVAIKQDDDNSNDLKPTQQKLYGLKLQPMPLPKFSGNIREYPRFKDDFKKQVMPSVSETQQTYVLKSCLSDLPLEIVKNVDHSISEMWQRLDEKYGEPSKVIDAIMKEIKKLKSIKDNDNNKFIHLVDIVERAYRDLKRLNLHNEISNASTVSLIEEKLPYDIKLKWGEKVKGSKFSLEYDDVNKFPLLMNFLIERKSILEYVGSDLRSSESTSGNVHFADRQDENTKQNEKSDCWIHQNNSHNIIDCPEFLQMTSDERFECVKDNHVCWSCLKPGHRSVHCWKRKKCSEDGCELSHHNLLHNYETHGTANHHQSNPSYPTLSTSKRSCLLQLMKVRTSDGENVNVLWDGGATLSLITFKKAADLGLHGEEIKLSVTKVGGISENINSNRYNLTLKDKDGVDHNIIVYGIEKISTELNSINLTAVSQLFQRAKPEEISRPYGEIDVLIGFEYAGYHPTKKECNDHLLLLENRFGKCLGGSHPLLRETTRKLVKHAMLHHAKISEIDQFFDIENLGVQCTPKCGACRCGNCSLGGSNCTIQEEKELHMIENGLIRRSNHWEASYPWIRDPSLLQDNKPVVFAMLKSLERRLMKNKDHAATYQAQILDMLERNVARKLTNEELNDYKGPVQYISHHEVLKKDSQSTPCRIVFNSSAKHCGYSLNDYWAKGPDVINDMLGILLRFREGQFALAGDIKKMYHCVHLSLTDIHTHRFLWRDLNVTKDPDVYAMTRVSFGDKPAGAIATVALRKTALECAESHPKAADTIVKNSYIDDLIDSFDSNDEMMETAATISSILETGGFSIKHWLTSNQNPSSAENTDIKCATPDQSKILGMYWEQSSDSFKFKIKLNFSEKHRKVKTGPDLTKEQLKELDLKTLNKRSVLSQISGIYDPMGLLTPFTVAAKIMMQQLWKSEKELGWDDVLPNHIAVKWIDFFEDMFEVEKLSFKRCIKPTNAVGQPMLILFSDASEDAYGTCAFVRWEKSDGSITTNLVAAKGKVAPIKTTSLPRLELCAAVLSKRLYVFIERECRYQFSKILFMVDSSIVHAMIQKESYGFKTFVSVRLGEIQQSTEKSMWYWVDGTKNIADWTTRPKKPSDIDESSEWQNGPSWLKLNEKDWPVRSHVNIENDLPDMKKHSEVFTAIVKEASNSDVIDLNRFSSYSQAINVTARIIAVCKEGERPSLSYIMKLSTLPNVVKAENVLIKLAQSQITDLDIQNRYKRLGAYRRKDGVIAVGTRLENWMKATYNNQEMILLPHNHRLARLYVEFIHNQGHTGISATACKVRLKFWIVKLEQIVRSVRFNCMVCRKMNKKRCEQIMGPLPDARLNPAPAWSSVSLDLFGPFVIRGEVNKRSRGKAYGLIINCLLTRAVHIDATPDYSTDTFLQALRRFMSFRGSPLKIFSDPGSQLKGAANIIDVSLSSLDQIKLKEFGLKHGFEWNFTAANAPWQNGCSEALIRSCKKAIHNSIGSQVLSIMELLTVFYECSNLLCERPIEMKSQDISDGNYLCPNDMLLGRATSRISSGPFEYDTSLRRRYLFLQSLVSAFWTKWNRFYFPTLLVRQKWHVDYRNLCIGDIVLMQDSNAIRGNWKLARVCNVYPSADGKVRKVEVEYKNCANKMGLDLPATFVKVQRPVQRLVLLLPKEEDADTSCGGNVSMKD